MHEPSSVVGFEAGAGGVDGRDEGCRMSCRLEVDKFRSREVNRFKGPPCDLLEFAAPSTVRNPGSNMMTRKPFS